MPKVTIELTNTQATKLMVANGWKPEELGVIVKRLVFEYISATAAPNATQKKATQQKTRAPNPQTETISNGLGTVLVTSGDA